MSHSPIIVALDFPTAEPVLRLARQLDPDLCRLKVGKELFTRTGPALVETLQQQGYEIFLDLKFHDIPNTVAAACRAAAELGVWMVDVHASGGRRMLIAAREALVCFRQRPLLIGVTVLTSLEQTDLDQLGWHETPEQLVLRLARLARGADLDGVVCSAREAAALRQALGPAPLLVTPGIRLPQALPDDQRRVMTPREALDAGASHLVIGRPITRAPDPLDALQTIVKNCAIPV
jgi:orotidine-5'-phosphate decarboxylase